MNRNPLPVAVATALLCSLALLGCKKKDEPVPAPVVIDTPRAAPAPMPASTATATVTRIDLGNSAGADMRISTPMTSFGKRDTIIAAVSTSTSQPASIVPAKIATRWTYQDGQVINEEARDVKLSGDGVTDFLISKPSGFAPGKYRLEISLDGRMVQGKEFEVK